MAFLTSTSKPWRRSTTAADAPACLVASAEPAQRAQHCFNSCTLQFLPTWCCAEEFDGLQQKYMYSSDGYFVNGQQPEFCAVDLDDFTDDDDDDDDDTTCAESEALKVTAENQQTKVQPHRNYRTTATVREPDAEPTPQRNAVVAPPAPGRSLDSGTFGELGNRKQNFFGNTSTTDNWAWESDSFGMEKPGVKKDEAGSVIVSPSSRVGQQRTRRLATAALTDAEIKRTIKGILNKLTIEKFSRLSKQLLECGITTVHHIEILINEIFEKATQQHNFIDMYADLCVEANDFFSTKFDEGDRKPKFRRLLLDKCQSSFQNKLTPPENLHLLEEDERTLAEVKYKEAMLGNIRFVGALLTRGMLASKIFIAILHELLSDPTAEAFEATAALLTVAGSTFDRSEWTHHNALLAFFDQLEGLVQQPTCSPRSRFLLKDVLELRERGWQDIRAKRVEQPTTLAKQAEKAAQASSPVHSQSSRGGYAQNWWY